MAAFFQLNSNICYRVVGGKQRGFLFIYEKTCYNNCTIDQPGGRKVGIYEGIWCKDLH